MFWEEEAPAESRVRRMQQVAPRSGRNLPGMPPEFDDPDEDGDPRAARRRFGADRADRSSGHWWWPASTTGRVFVGIGAAVILGAFLAAGITIKHFLERDARFRIGGMEDIQAAGLTEVPRAQMLPVFGGDIGRNVFFVPLNERRRELEQIPWIEHATVMRLLPDQIRVSVIERTPVAFTRHGQQIGLVDPNGVLLGMSASAMAAHHYSFPVITGIDPGDPADSRRARMALYLRMMSELDGGGKRNSEQISEIDLTDPEDARVLMPAQGMDILAHFGEDHFLDRFERYQAHIAEWRQQYPHLASVDLRYDNQVVLQMASGKEKAQDSTDASAGAPAASETEKPSPSAAASAPPAATVPKKSKPSQSHKHSAAKRAALKTARHTPSARPAAPVIANQQGGQ